MKILSSLLLGFQWQQRSQIAPSRNEPGFPLQQAATSGSVAGGNDVVLDVLGMAELVGQVGSLASEDNQQKMEDAADKAVPFSEPKPARFPLTGEHRLVYSAAKGASSGRVFGNVVGKVSQFFEDDEIFYNRVDFGPLQIALRAKREIKNDSTIKVTFLETSFNLFGQTLKKSEVNGGGSK